jgi:nucleotide-binding universal stress UspA family protein
MKPRILVPFDFSASAHKALAWAADLHTTTRAEEPIHMVHVISSMSYGAPDSTLELLIPNADEIATLERQMTDFASKASARVTAKVVVRPIPIGDAVIASAEEAHADLIVMGTHGRTGMKRLVLGSVAEHVVRHAGCPVVTLR